MKLSHLIYIPFTGVKGRMTDEQLKNRIEIFKNYTLKSLENQTNKDFQVWLSFCAEDEQNPLLKELYRLDTPIRLMFNFEGLMYWNDRGGNKDLEQRLRHSLLGIKTRITKADYIYMTRLDSDDMLRDDVVDLIQKGKNDVKALTLRLGYMYNKDTNELAEWNPQTNPPFHTMVFPKDVFSDAKKHLEWYEDFKSHEDIVYLPHRGLGERGQRYYCVLIHGNQIGTVWEHPFRGKIIEDKSILRRFGVN